MQSLGCVGDCKDTPGVERGALAPARQHAQYGVSRDSSLKDFPERGGRASFEVANRLKCRRFVDLQTDHQPHDHEYQAQNKGYAPAETEKLFVVEGRLK